MILQVEPAQRILNPRGPKILIVNQYYPPDMAATAKVFKELVGKLMSNGHHVRVICGRPSYNPSGRCAWRILSKSVEDGVLVERVGSSGVGREKMWGRVANYLTFALMAAIRVLLSSRPDVVVAGSDPPFSVWIALLAGRGRPVVYSLRDLHPEFAIVSGMIKPGFITKLWEAIHRGGLKRCSLVVCLGETVAERVEAKGVAKERIVVIPDGAPPPSQLPNPAVVAELRGDSHFLCVHAGNLGGAGAWKTLARASKNSREGWDFLFIGDGLNSDLIRQAEIRLLPFRPESEVASVMAAGDLQVVTLRHGMEGLVVPSKLYTVLAHGRPVLAVAPDECEVSRIVRRWECGLVIDPSDSSDVVAKINWARSNPEKLAGMARRALEAAQHYSRGAHLDHLVRLIENQAGLARATGGGP